MSQLKKWSLIVGMIGVGISVSIFYLAINTFKYQQRFNEALLKPELSLEMAEPPRGEDALATYFTPINPHKSQYIAWCQVVNAGDKAAQNIRVIPGVDTSMFMSLPKGKKDTLPTEHYTLVPGTSQLLGAEIVIPFYALERKVFYVHFWVLYQSVLNKTYIFHKVYGFDFSEIVDITDDGKIAKFKAGRTYIKVALSEYQT